MPTESCFYLARNLETFMMINSRGSVRTQKIITQKMSSYRGSVGTQNMST